MDIDDSSALGEAVAGGLARVAGGAVGKTATAKQLAGWIRAAMRVAHIPMNETALQALSFVLPALLFGKHGVGQEATQEALSALVTSTAEGGGKKSGDTAATSLSKLSPSVREAFLWKVWLGASAPEQTQKGWDAFLTALATNLMSWSELMGWVATSQQGMSDAELSKQFRKAVGLDLPKGTAMDAIRAAEEKMKANLPKPEVMIAKIYEATASSHKANVLRALENRPDLLEPQPTPASNTGHWARLIRWWNGL